MIPILFNVYNTIAIEKPSKYDLNKSKYITNCTKDEIFCNYREKIEYMSISAFYVKFSI